MPPAVFDKGLRPPRDRNASEGGCFYPGEAARIAGITGLNYRQLRQLFRLVKGKNPIRRQWARFSFRDVMALKVAYRLAKGKRTKHRHTRLHFAQVERACEMLKKAYGMTDPLTQVQLAWDGPNIVARFEGVHFEAASGQLLLVAEQLTKKAAKVEWLARGEREELTSRLKAELRGLELQRRHVAKSCVATPVKAKANLGGS